MIKKIIVISVAFIILLGCCAFGYHLVQRYKNAYTIVSEVENKMLNELSSWANESHHEFQTTKQDEVTTVELEKDYVAYTADTLLAEFKEDFEIAKNKHEHEAIAITGDIKDIRSNQTILLLGGVITDDDPYTADIILCNIKYARYDDDILAIGNTITIKGSVDLVGNALGYVVTVDIIE